MVLYNLGFFIRFGFHSPLYFGLSINGASHAPSSSSSQSSGFVASGSTILSGSLSQSLGFVSVGSSIYSLSTQSDGFFALGSFIVFGFSKSQSSFKFPEPSDLPST